MKKSIPILIITMIIIAIIFVACLNGPEPEINVKQG
jgi:hypothetical protein